MSVKVAINGFGRIGRLAFRQMFGAEGYEVVAINDLTSPAMLAHLLKYDSAQGRYATGRQASPLSEDSPSPWTARPSKSMPRRTPTDLPWGEIGVDVVLECTGFYTSKDEGSGSHRRWRQEGCYLRSRWQRPEDHRLQRKREDPDR